MPTPIIDYATGRETTLVFGGEMVVPALVTGSAQPNECGGRQQDSWVSNRIEGYGVVEALGVVFNVEGVGIYSDDTVTNQSTVEYDALVTCMALGYSVLDSGVADDTGVVSPRSRPLTASSAGVFAWSVSIDAVERTLKYFMDEDVRGADGSPTYGGAATDDVIPRGTGELFYLVAKVGGAYQFSLSGPGGISISHSVEITEGLASALGVLSHVVYRELSGYGLNNAFGASISCVKTVSGVDVQMGYPASHSDNPNPFTTRTYDFSGPMALNVITSATWCDFAENGAAVATGRQRMWATYDHEWKYTGYLRTDADAYPGTLNATVSVGSTSTSVALSPSGSATIETRYAIGMTEGSVRFSVQEHGKARSWISSGVLSAAGEDSRDWRCLWRGKKVDAMRLRQLASVTVDGGSGATRSWTEEAPGNWEGYARLQVTLSTANAGETVRVSCGSSPAKSYECAGSVSAGVSVVRTIELCDPKSPKTATDDTDTRFPVRNDGLPHEDGPLQGIARILSLTATAPGGVTVTDYSLVATTRTVTFQCQFLGWEQTQNDDSVPSGVYPIIEAARGIIGRADNRRSFIVPVALRQLFEIVGGTIWVYSFPTVEQIVDYLVSTPGIEADTTPHVSTDPYLTVGGVGAADYTGLGLWLAGMGCTFSGETPTFWLDHDISSYATFPIQALADEYEGYPGMGDPFDSDDFDVPTPIRTCKFLRGCLDGAVYGLPGVDGPQEAETVELREEADDELRGDDLTDATGYYRTTDPYGKGNVDHYGQVVGRAEQVFVVVHNRRRQRIVFRIPVPFSPYLSADLSAGRRHYRAVANEDDQLVIQRRDNVLGGTWEDLPTGLEVDWASIRVDRGHRQGEVTLVTAKDGDGIQIRYSRDGGETWENMTTLAGDGRTPASCVTTPGGARHIAWLEGPDGGPCDVYRIVLDRGGNVVFPAGDVVNGVDDAGIALVFSPGDGGKARIELHAYVSDSLTEFVSTDGGETYT